MVAGQVVIVVDGPAEVQEAGLQEEAQEAGPRVETTVAGPRVETTEAGPRVAITEGGHLEEIQAVGLQEVKAAAGLVVTLEDGQAATLAVGLVETLVVGLVETLVVGLAAALPLQLGLQNLLAGLRVALAAPSGLAAQLIRVAGRPATVGPMAAAQAVEAGLKLSAVWAVAGNQVAAAEEDGALASAA